MPNPTDHKQGNYLSAIKLIFLSLVLSCTELFAQPGPSQTAPTVLPGSGPALPKDSIPPPLYTDYPIYLQSVQTALNGDFTGTLAALAKMGYRHLEWQHGRLFDRSPADIRDILDSLGLAVSGVHATVIEASHGFGEFCALAGVLGAPYIILRHDGPPTSPDNSASRNDLQALFRLADSAGACGLKLVYLASPGDFAAAGGGRPFAEQVRDSGDGRRILLAVDILQMTAANRNIESVFVKFASRIHSVYLNDFNPRGGTATIGMGSISWPNLLLKAKTGGVSHVVVNHSDASTLLSAELGLRYLSQLRSGSR